MELEKQRTALDKINARQEKAAKKLEDFMEGYYTTYVMLTQDGWVDKFEDGWTNFRNGGSDGNFLIWLIFFLAMVS